MCCIILVLLRYIVLNLTYVLSIFDYSLIKQYITSHTIINKYKTNITSPSLENNSEKHNFGKSYLKSIF